MIAFNFLSDRIPNLTETSLLRWQNPEYLPARYRRADDICIEMEQFATNVADFLEGFGLIINDNDLRVHCFEQCFKYILC